jgi:glycosyltransferase involved in cell wall biosynthesis
MDAPTVVLPLFRNADTVEPLLIRLVDAMGGQPFAVVGVDDACPDGSGAALLEAAGPHRVSCRLIEHADNRGQSAAIISGLRAAWGWATVVMDADLQDPPEVVPGLLAALREDQSAVAFGRRANDPRGAASRCAGRVFRRLVFGIMGARLPPDVALFLAMTKATRECLLAAPVDESLRLAALFGLNARSSLVCFEREVCEGRRSGYSAAGRLRLALRGLGKALAVRRRRSSLLACGREFGVTEE